EALNRWHAQRRDRVVNPEAFVLISKIECPNSLVRYDRVPRETNRHGLDRNNNHRCPCRIDRGGTAYLRQSLITQQAADQHLKGSAPLFAAPWKIYTVRREPRGFAIPELASHSDDLPPTRRQRVRDLHLSHRQPARRRGADHRPCA